MQWCIKLLFEIGDWLFRSFAQSRIAEPVQIASHYNIAVVAWFFRDLRFCS